MRTFSSFACNAILLASDLSVDHNQKQMTLVLNVSLSLQTPNMVSYPLRETLSRGIAPGLYGCSNPRLLLCFSVVP